MKDNILILLLELIQGQSYDSIVSLALKVGQLLSDSSPSTRGYALELLATLSILSEEVLVSDNNNINSILF